MSVATVVIAALVFPAAADSTVVFVHAEELAPRQVELLEGLTVREIDKLGIVAKAASSTADAGQAAACKDEPSCLGRLAAGLGGTRVVTVRVNSVHDSEVVTLKLIDLSSATVEKVITVSVLASDGALTALGGAVGKLFDRRAPPGQDPLGVETGVAERWAPKPIPKWGFAIGAVVTGVSAIAALSLGLASQAEQTAFQAAALPASDGRGLTADGETLLAHQDNAAALATGANIMIVVAAASAATTAVLAYYTDWGSDAVLAPMLGGDVAGASLSVRF